MFVQTNVFSEPLPPQPVTNEGDVSGKATKIVDYLPKDLSFSPEINNEWYVGTDGNIYTEGLADQEIKPGETKEITLVVTKVMKAAEAEIALMAL